MYRECGINATLWSDAPPSYLGPVAQWDVEWLTVVEDGKRTIPALKFLVQQEPNIRAVLLGIVDSVRTFGPDRWKDANSHKPMYGACSDLHEARDRYDQMLYRLFLKWQRQEQRVVVLTGASKPNNTTLPDSFYDDLAKMAATITTNPSPFATTDDVTRLLLDLTPPPK